MINFINSIVLYDEMFSFPMDVSSSFLISSFFNRPNLIQSFTDKTRLLFFISDKHFPGSSHQRTNPIKNIKFSKLSEFRAPGDSFDVTRAYTKPTVVQANYLGIISRVPVNPIKYCAIQQIVLVGLVYLK